MNPTSSNHLQADELLIQISDYVHDYRIDSQLAFKTAHLALLDSLACAILALKEPACVALLGPIVPHSQVTLGARVPGTTYMLEPLKAAFDIGTCIRWLDFNDTWLAKEWGHPSDNLGGILALCDFLSRRQEAASLHHLHMETVLEAMIKAYEIQGILALNHAFNEIGLDHVILVKIATTAVAAKIWGLSKKQTLDALSHAWIDGQALRTYRQAPQVTSRKSWAAGDATSRALWLIWLIQRGQTGMVNALTRPRWGFEDVYFKGKEKLKLAQPLRSTVMENILFKVSFPAEFHAQTAVEAALELYPLVKGKLEDIERIEIRSQAAALRIINKTGALMNVADRDHCLQYIVAIILIYGELKTTHYTDEIAQDPRIDRLRAKMVVKEDRQFSQDYLDPNKRSIPNSIQIFFKNGENTAAIAVHYPLGHPRRREEALKKLEDKYSSSIRSHFPEEQTGNLLNLWNETKTLSQMPVCRFMDFWQKKP